MTDHVEVTFEASHPIAEVILGLDGTAAFQRAYFYEDGEVPDLTFDAVLPPLPGEVTQATFCFVDAEAIGAQVDPAPPVTGTIPDPSMTVTIPDGRTRPGSRSPAPTPGPTVTTPAGGTLPKTGNDAVPVALVGVGLAAVGGGLLLGRRLRRAGA